MILITGGGGFIGSNLVATLSQKLGSTKIVISDRFGIDDKWKNKKCETIKLQNCTDEQNDNEHEKSDYTNKHSRMHNQWNQKAKK